MSTWLASISQFLSLSPVSAPSNHTTSSKTSTNEAKRKRSTEVAVYLGVKKMDVANVALSPSLKSSAKSIILIRVHECGKKGVQLEPFLQAQRNCLNTAKDLYSRVKLERIDNDTIRMMKWSPSEVVD
jgi:hypothetical protein